MDKVFSVYDYKAEVYGRPWTAPTTGVALRAFMDEVAAGKGDISTHPEDFALFEVGAWNEEVALLEPLVPPRLVAAAKDLAEGNSVKDALRAPA